MDANLIFMGVQHSSVPILYAADVLQVTRGSRTSRSISGRFRMAIFVAVALLAVSTSTIETALAGQPTDALIPEPAIGQSASASFQTTGSMAIIRMAHAAVLLPNGMVLMAGGRTTGAPHTASAELYNPISGTFTPTGSMTAPRDNFSATLLSNGKVFVAGGTRIDTTSNTRLAELYDPSTGTFTPTGNLGTPRTGATTTLLQNGRVLLAGGYDNSGGVLSSAEIYDPGTGTFTPTGSMGETRLEHVALLLPSGLVLVLGGRTNTVSATAELYDPAAGAFVPTGRMTVPRSFPTATLLRNGKVLIAGGIASYSPYVVLSTAEIYDPATGTFALTGSLITTRANHTATLLSSGDVLIAGGADDFSKTAETYNPSTASFKRTADMADVRNRWFSGTLLRSGTVLFAGGIGLSAGLATAELYDYPRPLKRRAAHH
jgi:hypothetical protein